MFIKLHTSKSTSSLPGLRCIKEQNFQFKTLDTPITFEDPPSNIFVDFLILYHVQVSKESGKILMSRLKSSECRVAICAYRRIF